MKAAGHEVVFFSMKDKRNWPYEHEEYFINNVDYNTKNIAKKVQYAVKYIYSLEAKKKIAVVLDREKPDIVHLNHIHHQITLSVVSEIKKRNIPMVFTLHDVICACPNYMMLAGGKICEDCIDGHYIHCFQKGCVKNSKIKSLLATIEAYNYKRMRVYYDIDAYISPTAFYKRKLSEAHFTDSPIFHIKNLLPLNTKYEIRGVKKNYCLYFGRLSKEKGILTLVKAISQCETRANLLIVGEGPLDSDIRQMIARYGLEHQIKMLGYKSGSELETIVREAKCVILPSEWYENGPYAIEEAMSYGTPTIVSRIGGLPEAVVDGTTGFICEPNDPMDLAKKIDMLFSLQESEYLEMCSNAVNKARNDFNAESYINMLTKIYTELIDLHKGRRR